MAHHKHQQGTSAINLAALSIAFEHPAISTELWILCAAARSCKAWREAVQQCAACNTAVEVCLAQPLSDLCSFARWLPKHALLVKSSNITAPRWREQVDGLPWGLHLEAAQQLLQMALQMATAPPVAAAAAAAPPPLPAIAAEQITAPYQPQQLLQQSWQQQLVRLPAISSITMMCTKNNMLAALPAHSLTHLYLKTLEWPYGRLALSAALTRLSNLQQLHLVYPDTEAGSCLTGLAQLTQLTLLELDCYYAEKSMLQQLLAQPLPLRVLRLQSAYWEDHLDLSHVTQLQEFSNKESCRTSGELNTSFPEQLQKLEAGSLHHEDDFQALLQLQQLHSLAFADYVGDPELLLRLAQLPALQQLSLRYAYGDAAADAAAVWLQLPQLRELEVTHDELRDMQQWHVICNGIAASSSLTKLELDVVVYPEDQEHDGPVYVEVCAKLAGLTNLKALCMADSCLVPGDALALTALTGLTRLELKGTGAGVGDLAATAIASSCQQLPAAAAPRLEQL